MPIVAERYAIVIGVDTRAATHSFALINATNGGVIDQAVFRVVAQRRPREAETHGTGVWWRTRASRPSFRRLDRPGSAPLIGGGRWRGQAERPCTPTVPTCPRCP